MAFFIKVVNFNSPLMTDILLEFSVQVEEELCLLVPRETKVGLLLYYPALSIAKLCKVIVGNADEGNSFLPKKLL